MSHDNNKILSLSIDAFCNHIHDNIKRRKSMIEGYDLFETKIVGNRIMSNKISNISGFDKHLKRASLIRKKYLDKEVIDFNSHSSVKIVDREHSRPTYV